MPCYQVNRISVEIQATDRDLLEEAIKSLGLGYNRMGNDFTIAGTITITGNEASLMPGAQETLNQVKVTYSKEVVKKVAKKKGWIGTWKKVKSKPTITLKKF